MYQICTWHTIFRTFSWLQFDFGGVYGQDEWYKLSKCSASVVVLKFPSPNKLITPTDMARCHSSIYWLLYNTSCIDVCKMKCPRSSTLALSECSPIGFVQKQMGTVTDPLWRRASIHTGLFQHSGSLDSDLSLKQRRENCCCISNPLK